MPADSAAAAPRGVPDLLRVRATVDPDVTALVVDGGPSLTCGQWDRRSDAVAAGLHAAGVRPGERVVLHFDNVDWVDYAVCYVAVHKVGAAVVPTSPRLSTAELAWVVEHAGATLVVCPNAAPVDGVASVCPTELAAVGGAPPSTVIDPDGLAEIIYTSGTTGHPRGVAVSHANLLVHDLPGSPPATPVAFAHAFPIGTNAGQECLRMPLRRPATAVVLPAFDPERLCAAVASRRVRRLQLVPAMAEMLLTSGASDRHDVSSVERIILSSAPAPPPLWGRLAAAFPAASLFNAYALTEAGGARTLMRHDPDRPGSVGRPVGRSQVRVVNEGGEVVAADVVGEVQLRRVGAPRRVYFHDPEATATAFDGDWLRTGDLGFLDADGFLHLVDRAKDLIISGGANIATGEVEHALYRHPAVREAAVFGVAHATLGQAVAAAVTLHSPVTERQLQAVVRSHLGEHKVPRRIHVLDRLPRNASGKVLKRDLPGLVATAVERADLGPPTDVEAAVAAVWQQALGRDDIGVHDDFFELGGHSLAATQVVARLEDIFDAPLPVTAVFEAPTVAELATVVTEALADTARA